MPVEMIVPVQKIVPHEVPVFVDKYVKQPTPFDVEKVCNAKQFLGSRTRTFCSLRRSPQVVLKEVAVSMPVEKVRLDLCR